MTKPTEKQLDRALELEFKTNSDFTRWFLSQTKFADRNATYSWSRSDHPWGTINYSYANPETGALETSRRQCETDVLVILRTQDNETVALHIENKIGLGKFTDLQPEMYAPRAEQWKGNPKYQSYTDFQTVLVAPQTFRDRHMTQASLFDCFVTHEEVSKFIPLFGQL